MPFQAQRSADWELSTHPMSRSAGCQDEKECLKQVAWHANSQKKLRLKGLQMEMILGERGAAVGGQRMCTKHVSGLVSNMLRCGLKYSKIEVERVADGDDPSGKGGSCGRTEDVYEACFRVCFKHASLRAKAFKKLRFKGLLSFLHMYLSHTCRTATNRILRSTSTIPTTRKRCCFWVPGLTLFFFLQHPFKQPFGTCFHFLLEHFSQTSCIYKLHFATSCFFGINYSHFLHQFIATNASIYGFMATRFFFCFTSGCARVGQLHILRAQRGAVRGHRGPILGATERLQRRELRRCTELQA